VFHRQLEFATITGNVPDVESERRSRAPAFPAKGPATALYRAGGDFLNSHGPTETGSSHHIAWRFSVKAGIVFHCRFQTKGRKETIPVNNYPTGFFL